MESRFEFLRQAQGPPILQGVGDESHPRFGFEFDWLAIDVEGHIALFDSAGYGAVPPAVLDHVEETDAAVEAVRRWPSRCQFVREAEGKGAYSQWFEDAGRGLYVYDFHYPDGPYRRIATPTEPITIEDISDSEVRAVALLVELPSAFHESRTFHLPYATPPRPPSAT